MTVSHDDRIGRNAGKTMQRSQPCLVEVASEWLTPLKMIGILLVILALLLLVLAVFGPHIA